jgi:hypothetical protein
MKGIGFFWYFADLTFAAHSCHKVAGDMVNESRVIRISCYENHCVISRAWYFRIWDCYRISGFKRIKRHGREPRGGLEGFNSSRELL